MASIKISGLTEQTTASDTDLLPVASSTGMAKRMTLANFVTWLASKLNSKFAPAGYGLGGAKRITAAMLDSTTAPGFYDIAETMTINNITANYWYMIVTAYGSGSAHCTQELRPVGTAKCRLERSLRSSVWDAWESDNPPMVPGVEYRTTERWNEKPVYTKLVDCGLSSNNKQISHSLGGTTAKILRYTGTIGADVLPYFSGSTYESSYNAWLTCGEYYIVIHCGSALTEENVTCQIWYTKE